MTDEQKKENYENYLESMEPFDEPVLTYDEFAESITADDTCEQCKKLGENTCDNDIDCRCFEPIE